MCEDCRTQQNNEESQSVERYAFEAALAMAERTIKRLWITTILLIVLLVGSNAAWIWYESQFEEVVWTQEVVQDANNGTNNFVGGDEYSEAED